MAGCVRPFRRRPGLLFLIVAVPYIIVFLMSSPDRTLEITLPEKLINLKAKLQHLDSLNRARREEIRALSHHLAQFLINSQADNTTLKNLESTLSPEVRILLRNLTGAHPGYGELLKLPSIYNFLPHLLENPFSLRPGFQFSNGRTGVSVALGIPSVKREHQSYLLPTLRNLIDSMDEKERADTLIVVLVAEIDMNYVVHIANQIKIEFFEHLQSGLIDIIAPHSSYYPNFDNYKRTLGDTLERVRWRSKQNLDYAFVMMYCQTRATFYVQLEDDILATKGFVTRMKKFALNKIASRNPWFVLGFCKLGFIGKMFKSIELPLVIQFFLVFFNDKPVDWLLDDILTTKLCHIDSSLRKCRRMKSKVWVNYKPSLFQHIGTHSSLKGKVQELQDEEFGKMVLFFPHSNPKARVHSAVIPYKRHTFERAYHGDTYFWGLLPQDEDLLTIKFDVPIAIKNYLFRSGNVEHPNDKFFNTTVEAFPVHFGTGKASANTTSDGYVVVGEFDSGGVAEGKVDLGKVRALRLHVHSGSNGKVILSEILIESEEES